MLLIFSLFHLYYYCGFHCIPKREVDYFFDLTDEEIAAMQVFAKHVAEAVKEVLPCRKVGQAVLGLEVPHAHIHLVPMQSEGDLNFANAKKQFAPEEMQQTADAIRQAFEKRELKGS